MKLLPLACAIWVMAIPMRGTAAPVPSVGGAHREQWLRYAQAVGSGPDRAIYYYTSVVLTGSHVPVVIRRYHGHLEIVAGGVSQSVIYGAGDLAGAGADDVGGELARIDPAISVGGPHR